MLLSYQPPFLFVHIDKAAGSSIQLALQPHVAPSRPRRRWRRRLAWLGSVNRLGGLYRTVEFPEHASARLVQRSLPPEVYSNLFKFAFVRNPWDRLVSRYSYLKRNDGHPRHALVNQLSGFDEYVEWEIRRGRMFQHTYVTDLEGRAIVDFVGRFENLEADFARACAQLRIKAELPKANASSHRDYRTYYSDATRQRVAECFKSDIELFGYTFDGMTESMPLFGSRC